MYHSPGSHALSFLRDSNVQLESDPSWPTAATEWLKVGYKEKSIELIHLRV